MSLEWFLNELSFCPIAGDVNGARERVAEFVQTLARANNVAKKRLPLRVSSDFFAREVSFGYPLSKWRNDHDVNLDIRRYFRQIATKSPYIERNLKDRALGCEVCLDGIVSIGLLAAYLSDGMVISFRSEPRWDCSSINVSVSEMDQNASISTENKWLPHASSPAHIDGHRSWIGEHAAPPFTNHGDLWNRRVEKFPFLEFCDRVEGQLAGLSWNDHHHKQVIKKLKMLNDWCGDCSQRSLPRQRWADEPRCRLSPESQQTLSRFVSEHTFLCPDGQRRLFSWHARFTPGAGRIYFTWADEGKRLIIGHVGEHLPTVDHQH